MSLKQLKQRKTYLFNSSFNFDEVRLLLFDLIDVEYQISRGSNARLTEQPQLPVPKPHFIIHLPKCAGSLLRQLAPANVQELHIRDYWMNPLNDTDLIRDFLFSFEDPSTYPQVVIGHFPYGFHLFAPSQTGSYFTFLRNPVARVWSHYLYHNRTTGDPNHAVTKTMSVETWIRTSINARDRMTQYLSGRENMVSSHKSLLILLILMNLLHLA